jgi:actin-related protein
MTSEKDKNIVLRLGSRSIECGLQGSAKPLAFFNVHHFAEKQNFTICEEEEINPFNKDHTLAIKDLNYNKLENDIKLQRAISSDLSNFQYIFHPDILVYNEFEIFESDLKIHLRKLLTIIFYKCGVSTINAKLVLLYNLTFSDFYIKIISEILINQLLMRAVVVVPSPLMSCIASGSSSAIVVDIGWSFTTIDSVFDNRILNNLSTFTNKAGSMVHYTILSNLVKNGYDISNITFKNIENALFELESIEKDGEKTLVCGPYFINSKIFTDVIKNVCILMNENNSNNLDANEKPIVQLIVELIEKKLPIDLKKTLSNKIIITGGLANLLGFKELMMNEIQNLLDSKNANNTRTLGPWVGASIYSDTMKHLKKSKDLWEIRKE